MNIKSVLVYRDGCGRYRLRDYVKVALGILVIIGVVVFVARYNRDQMASEVMATPRPLDYGLPASPTESITTSETPVAKCPSDPAEWTLAENPLLPGSNLKVLAPQCVREQVDKTAAWFYATSVYGYSRDDAARLLGFSQLPISYSFNEGKISVLTGSRAEPQTVDLRFPSNHSGLSEWRIDENGSPAVEFTFRGCFRTTSIQGGQVVSWGGNYSVICQYAGDFRTRHYIGMIHGKAVTASGVENTRRFFWIGYDEGGMWAFLGIAKAWEYDLDQIQKQNVSTINPSVLATVYNIFPQPLPDNWEASSTPSFIDAFVEELRSSN